VQIYILEWIKVFRMDRLSSDAFSCSMAAMLAYESSHILWFKVITKDLRALSGERIAPLHHKSELSLVRWTLVPAQALKCCIHSEPILSVVHSDSFIKQCTNTLGS
jgi:hypothetical protein